jgi:hypothetical protein
MQKSDSLDMLGQAMADAQPAVKTAIMGSTNPFFKSKYADLGAVWDAIREALKSKGLSIVQMPDALGSDPALTTILLHESGQWISGTYPLVVSSKDETAQGYGSAMTYARRYGLAAVMGVIADEDDDGNAASKPASKPHSSQNNSGAAYPKPIGLRIETGETLIQPATAASEPSPTKPKQTAKEWGNSFLNEIRGLPLDMLDPALVKNSAALVKLHITEPVLHKDIIALVQQRQSLGK